MFDVHLLITPEPLPGTSMKKLLTAIAAAVFVIYPSGCFSSFIIHLKDGREFATDRYYEEGDQIKFKRYGGVIGIQKDLVRDIEVVEEVEELPAEKEKAEPTKEAVSQPAKKQGAEKEVGAKAEEKVKEGKEEVPEKVAKEQGVEQAKAQEKLADASEKEKKNLIDKYTKEFNLINEKFKDVQMMTKEDLYKFADKLIAFKKGVLSNRLGGIFSKHLLEIYSMLDKIEAILKFRGD